MGEVLYSDIHGYKQKLEGDQLEGGQLERGRCCNRNTQQDLSALAAKLLDLSR